MYFDRADIGEEAAAESQENLRSLQLLADAVADDVRSQLSDAFAVESNVVSTPIGPQGAIAVHAPDGQPVAAGIGLEEVEEFTGPDRRDLAQDIIATAVNQASGTVADRFHRACQ